MVHGDRGVRIAQEASTVLFGGDPSEIPAEDLEQIFAHVPSSEHARDTAQNALALDLATESGLCKSKSEARRLIGNGGLYVNNARVADLETRIDTDAWLDKRLLLLRSGKRNFHLVRISD